MPWLNVSAIEIANRRLPLDELWGRRAWRLAEQLFETATSDGAAAVLERFLSARMPADERSDRADQNLRRALEARLRMHETPVRDLAADLGVSERTIRRRCNELFGYGPKTFARILRFQQFIACGALTGFRCRRWPVCAATPIRHTCRGNSGVSAG